MTIRVHNITIDGTWGTPGSEHWNADQYERVVRRVLVRVFTSAVGGAIIPRLRRELRIVPFDPNIFPGAGAAAEPHTGNNAALRGSPRFQCGGPAMGQPLPGASPGSGIGSDVTIWFTPADWEDPTRFGDNWVRPLPWRPTAPGVLAEEVLCHELTHAVRQMEGVLNCVGVGHGYSTYEEYIAVQVTNVYASLRHRPIAADYTSGRVRDWLMDPFSTRDREEARWLGRMRAQQPRFFQALREISPRAAPYNPFRHFGSDDRYLVER